MHSSTSRRAGMSAITVLVAAVLVAVADTGSANAGPVFVARTAFA
jgi:Tfp pilus assembly protein PilV